MPRNYLFWHCALNRDNPDSPLIIHEQIRKIAELPIDLTRLSVGIPAIYDSDVGACREMIRSELDHIPLVFCTTNPQLEELATLELLWRTARVMHEQANFGYIHTKGAWSSMKFPSVHGWRHLLEHFNLIQADRAVKRLDGVDMTGCLYSNDPCPHFSGNFWWARSSYIRRLPNPMPHELEPFDRNRAEFWIGSLPHTAANIYDAKGLDLYHNVIEASTYE